MTDIDLTRRPGCFDGVIPPVLATCSGTGVPNIAHVSQLSLVDRDHIAVSNQYFSKTVANLATNPRAAVLITDSQGYDTFHLDLEYERTETSGPLFDELRAGIEAISVLMHMEDVFALRGADIYRVVEVRALSS
ncbi:MAG: adenylate cyclase [Actinomycetota bacterium]|nr:adenylate cyclase [Actinomycetota bacterium]